MDWDDLRYVLAVARAGTLSDAAKRLRVNSTTVSRRIRALEASSGTALFDKLKHGAVLTSAGHEMVRVAEVMDQLANELDARIHGLDARLEGTLRVTAADMVVDHFIPDFAAFRERYPRVRLELLSSYRMANLTRREADVAIRISPRAPSHLIGRKLVEVLYAVYGSAELVDEVGAEASYASYPWLSWDLSVARATDDYLAAHAKGANIVMRVDTSSAMLGALRQGVGITILPCFCGDRAPGLVRIGDYFEGGTHLWVLTHPELRGTARVKAFTDRVRGLVERDRDLFSGQRPAC